MATQSALIPRSVERRTEKLDVRISASVKAKLQAAANSSRRSLSEFVLESALSRADEVLADRRTFELDAVAWAAFVNALDAPAKVLPRMRKLLQEPSVFDTAAPYNASLAFVDSVNFSSREDLEKIGLEGFRTVLELQQSSCQGVPEGPGIFCVLRPNTDDPKFLQESIGGHFKGKNPTVSLDFLRRKWVSNSLVLYIGMSRKGLKELLDRRVKFGMGQPVGAKGGRLTWQLEDSKHQVICWKEFPNGDPKVIRDGLLSRFEQIYRSLPFANLQRPTLFAHD